MNRIIKFRAWHIVNKMMVQHENISVELKNVRNNNHFKYMQFIGLKDKNGKEIYEGDIVKHHNGIHCVEYWDSSASFQMDLSNSVLDQEICDYSEVEVIGNIYENKDLL